MDTSKKMTLRELSQALTDLENLMKAVSAPKSYVARVSDAQVAIRWMLGEIGIVHE